MMPAGMRRERDHQTLLSGHRRILENSDPSLRTRICWRWTNRPACWSRPTVTTRRGPNLMKLLHRDLERAAPWAKARGLHYLMNAHRLDFPTSGVLLLAKDKPTLVALANQFGSEKPVKVYAALVRGAAKETSLRVRRQARAASLAAGLHPRGSQERQAGAHGFHRAGNLRRLPVVGMPSVDGADASNPRPSQAPEVAAGGRRVYGGAPLWLSTLKTQYRLKPGHSERR
jgi:hypothetical protein